MDHGFAASEDRFLNHHADASSEFSLVDSLERYQLQRDSQNPMESCQSTHEVSIRMELHAIRTGRMGIEAVKWRMGEAGDEKSMPWGPWGYSELK